MPRFCMPVFDLRIFMYGSLFPVLAPGLLIRVWSLILKKLILEYIRFINSGGCLSFKTRATCRFMWSDFGVTYHIGMYLERFGIISQEKLSF